MLTWGPHAYITFLPQGVSAAWLSGGWHLLSERSPGGFSTVSSAGFCPSPSYFLFVAAKEPSGTRHLKFTRVILAPPFWSTCQISSERFQFPPHAWLVLPS